MVLSMPCSPETSRDGRGRPPATASANRPTWDPAPTPEPEMGPPWMAGPRDELDGLLDGNGG